MNVQNNVTNFCPLCSGKSDSFFQNTIRKYHQCNNCLGIFVDKDQLPDREAEALRYKQHNNNVDDIRYQDFVSPITSNILKEFTKDHKGLDFGAGTGPVISKISKDNDYQIKQYDPLFHNYQSLLEEKYHYIACCEVIEHFHNPYKEFKLLKKLLSDSGKLYYMTNIYDESIDFENWDYITDITHVFFYHKRTLEWIKEEFGFIDILINDRLIIFSN